MASKMGTLWKKYKKEIILFILLGMFILFLANNFTTQGVYDVVSCTWNQHECNITADCECEYEWDGICTNEIKDECCIDIDMCNGQVVENPYECYHYYCTDPNKFCDATYDQEQGGQYVCGCADIGGFLLY